MRILVAEDEPRIAAAVARGLRREGMAVDIAPDGAAALYKARINPYDVIVLDVMLPDINGFETCRRLRTSGVWTPVLMLTARDSVDDRVAGLDTGADDYLVKPFAFAELLARLRALSRRGDGERPPVLEVGDLRLDPATAGWAVGRPGGRACVQAWFRFHDGREPDPLVLLLAVDALPPTTFELGRMGWAPTLELTAHVRARPAPGWLRLRHESRNMAGGMFEEDCEVWDSTGRLVAQSRQLALQPRS